MGTAVAAVDKQLGYASSAAETQGKGFILGRCANATLATHLMVSALGATKPLPSSSSSTALLFTAVCPATGLEAGARVPWDPVGGGWDGTCPPGSLLEGGGRAGGGSMGSASSSESPRTTMVCGLA